MNFTTLVAAATLATMPLMASAVTTTILDDQATIIDATNVDELFLFDAHTENGDFNHTFTLPNDGSGIATVSVTPNILNLFETFVASWLGADTPTSVDLTTGATSLATTFADQTSLSQTLNLTWTLKKGVDNFIFDGDVTISTVPVPAGLLLMGTALAGLGLTRRKA
jgi:hypothetical protein